MIWDQNRVKLFYAVYAATARQSRFVPSDSIGSGLHLKRGMDAKYLQGTEKTIAPSSVLGAITVRDATKDSNRFTGIGPSPAGSPAVPVRRGGLYTSEDNTALLAEMFHYADRSLPRDMYGKAPVLDVLAPKCLIKMKAVREIIIADLDTSSEATQRFFQEIEGDEQVAGALKALGYRSLSEAVLHPKDYSAGRGLGLGLASNESIDGMRITSAREFTTSEVVGETGNNVVLFGENLEPATGLVQVTSMHIIERNEESGKIEAVHFTPSGDGAMTETGSTELS
jgi:hypothetical protein